MNNLPAIYLKVFFASALLFICQAAMPTPPALNRLIDITVKEQPLGNVLRQLETETGLRFVYNPAILNRSGTVSLSLQKTSLRSALQEIINDGSLVFYQHEGYIVISTRRDLPKGTEFVYAKPATSSGVVYTSITDTLTLVDTIVYIDTVRLVVWDTIRVYDTLTAKMPAPGQKPNSMRSLWQISAEQFNGISFLSGQVESKPGFFNFTRLIAQRSIGRFFVGAGAGYMRHSGATAYTSYSQRTDSILYSAQVSHTHVYELGRYYLVVPGADTAWIVLYDSVQLSMPYNWYGYSNTTVSATAIKRHSLSWLSIPIRAGFSTPVSNATDAGAWFGLSPAIALRHSGSIAKKHGQTIAASSIEQRLHLFFSASVYVSAKKNNSSLRFGPEIHCTLLPLGGSRRLGSFSAGMCLSVAI
jgi:hypothetical protein